MAMYERKHVLRESFFPAENMPLIRMRKAQFVLRKVFDHDEEEKTLRRSILIGTVLFILLLSTVLSVAHYQGYRLRRSEN